MKKLFLLVLLNIFTFSFSQDLIEKVPEKTPFLAIFNGKVSNEKLNIKTIDQYEFIQNLFFKKDKNIRSVQDFGIDLTQNQYHYYSNRDSVKSYVMLLPITDSKKIESFLQSKKNNKKTIVRKNNYSYYPISKESYLGWNNRFAIFVGGNYRKEINYDYSKTIDSVATAVDSVTVARDSAINAATDSTAVKIDEYSEVIDSAVAMPKVEQAPKLHKKSKINSKKSYKKSKKTSKKTQKEVEEENAEKAAVEAAIEAASAENEEDTNITDKPYEYKEEDANDDYDYQKEYKIRDSLEKQKLQKNAEIIFEDSFNSNFPSITSKQNLKENINPKSDFSVWIDGEAAINEFLSLDSFYSTYFRGTLSNSIYNSNFYINGNFEKNRILISQKMTPKNENNSKMLEAVYHSKIDKKLLNYVGEKAIGYYSVSLNTEPLINYQYDFYKNYLNSLYSSYSKEENNSMDAFVDLLAVIIDEKAIAELFPGDAIFVMKNLKEVEKDYVYYDYDDDYNSIKKKGKKNVYSPDFTFVFSTKNEKLIEKFLKIPSLNKKYIKKMGDYQLKNGFYDFEFEDQELIKNLYFGVKNGVAMITTSKADIENLIAQKKSEINPEFKKTIKNNANVFWLNSSELFKNISNVAKDRGNRELNYLSKNLGEISVVSNYKNKSLNSEIIINTTGNHENSLQAVFDMMNEFYKFDIEKDKEREEKLSKEAAENDEADLPNEEADLSNEDSKETVDTLPPPPSIPSIKKSKH